VSRTSPDGVARTAVVVADAAAAAAAPPGVDGREYALAMAEDVLELVGDLSIVDPALLCVPRDDPAWTADVAVRSWPGTPVGEYRGQASGEAVLAAVELASAQAADAAVVVTGDAPDLPGLLLGKLLRALGSAEIACCTTGSGALVALATRLPVPVWLTPGLASFDTADALARLRAAAPDGSVVAEGPGWHRLREPADVRRLDPGLEGWDATRALLSARPT